jgi:hypothetical protein
MKPRHLLALFVALIVTPAVLGIGTILLIPVALVLLPALVIGGIAALPALFAAASTPRAAEPAVAAEHAAGPALPASSSIAS